MYKLNCKNVKSMERDDNLPKNSLGLTCLNAGCGNSYFKDWINLDFRKSAYVQYCNLRQGIPYPHNTFDLVYSSNIIEHFSYRIGQEFIQHSFRVLKPGGTIRLLTPDLERIAKEYLKNLNVWAQEKSKINRQRYEWILLEMFDQMTREKSGGLMLKKIQAGDVCPEYVIYRTGDELRGYLYPTNKNSSQGGKNYSQISLSYRTLIFYKGMLRRIFFYFVKKGREKVPFNESGELHKWYYDRVSLEYLFRQIGFVGFKVVDYKTSRISGWEKMNLDISTSGDGPRKPDSIIVEANKPKTKL